MMRYLLNRGVSVGGHEVKEALRVHSIPALEMLREYGWKVVNMNLGEGVESACTAWGRFSLDFSFFDFPPPLRCSSYLATKVD